MATARLNEVPGANLLAIRDEAKSAIATAQANGGTPSAEAVASYEAAEEEIAERVKHHWMQGIQLLRARNDFQHVSALLEGVQAELREAQAQNAMLNKRIEQASGTAGVV